jgi:hypothetical protein
MAGTTKEDLQAFLKDFANWANAIQNQVTSSPAFKNLPKGAEVPSDSPIWDLLKANEKDPLFQRFLSSCSLAVVPEAAIDATNIEFRNFLENMSQSMVQTQQLLDNESTRYLAATAGKAHIQPSVFRIPKLSAQMRFALEIQNGKTLNLVFYKQDEKTTSRNEQAIDFEVVTVPAPPGALQSVAKLAPRLDLVLDPFERQKVLDGIGAATAPADPKGLSFGPILDAAAVPNNPDVVIVSAEADPGTSQYLVFLATEDTDHSVGVWVVTLADDGTAALDVIFRFNKSNSTGEPLLQKVILAVAAKQNTYFSD